MRFDGSGTERRVRLTALAAFVVLLMLAALIPTLDSSDATFTATKSNPANSFAAASSFQAQVASGTYSGNNSDDRNITGLAFQPNLVIVKAATSRGALMRTSTMSGDVSKPLFGATALANDRIQSLLANGFQVGRNNTVNESGVTYQWFAAATDVDTLSVGSYTGNGAANRSITGLGHSPEAVMLLGAGAQMPVMRMQPMSSSFRFDSGSATTSAINSLDGNGFTVGNSASSNTNGTVYHWIGFSERPGALDVGSYAGNDAASRSITGLGFQPAVAIVRSGNAATARAGIWRTGATGGTGSYQFAAAPNDTNSITGLGADGFTVGANTNANATGTTYSHLALEAYP